MSDINVTFEISSPTHHKKISVEWMEIESPTGSFFVGPQHSPLVSIIKPQSPITYKEINGPVTTVEVAGGIFIVNNNRAIALLDR